MTCVSFEVEQGVFVSYQQVDLSTTCSTDGETMTRPRRFLVYYSSLMALVYPVGMPALLYLLMWLKRRAIEERESRLGPPELENLSFLFGLFGRAHWSFAPVDLVRRLLLSSALLALPTVELIFMASFCVSTLSVSIYREVGPYW